MNNNSTALKNISAALQAIQQQLKTIIDSEGVITTDDKRALLHHVTALMLDAALLETGSEPGVQPWPEETVTVSKPAAATPTVTSISVEPAAVTHAATPSQAPKNSLHEAGAQQNTSSLNEKFGAPADKNVANKLGGKHIARLAQGIPLNDRIQFIKHLFAGAEPSYTAAITQLDAFNTGQEALQYLHNVLMPMHKWQEDDSMLQSLADLVRRRYS